MNQTKPTGVPKPVPMEHESVFEFWTPKRYYKFHIQHDNTPNIVGLSFMGWYYSRNTYIFTPENFGKHLRKIGVHYHIKRVTYENIKSSDPIAPPRLCRWLREQQQTLPSKQETV